MLVAFSKWLTFGRGRFGRGLTSPKSTSVSVALSLVEFEEAKLKVYGTVEASVGGKCWRHVPSAAAIASNVLLVLSLMLFEALSMVIVTVAPAAVQPHTTACLGALCSTIWEPSVELSKP